MSARRPPQVDVAAADIALRAAWARGDHVALVDLTWAACAVDLARYFLRAGVPESDVDDLRQEVLAQFVHELDGFDGGSIRGWVFTLARYQLWTWRKQASRRKRRAAATATPPPAEFPSWDKRLDHAAFLHDIADALTPANHLLLRAFAEGGDDAAVAADLSRATGRDWNVNMVRCQRRRLREEVRERYQDTFEPRRNRR